MRRLLLSAFALCLLFLSASTFAEEWKMENGRLWSRDAQAITSSKDAAEKRDGRESLKIVHMGELDWALSEGKRIPVKPGDVFEISAWIKFGGKGSAALAAVTRRQGEDVVQWSYADKEVRGTMPWTLVKTVFIVPEGIETIEPRLMGDGPATLWVDDFTVARTGFRDIASPKDAKPIREENKFLKLDVQTAEGTFSVTDKRTGRVWSQQPTTKNFVVVPGPVDGKKTSFQLLNTETLVEYGVELSLDADKPELLVQLNGNGPMAGAVPFPAPFASKSGDRLIIPMNEGISYPVEEQDIEVRRLVAYGGHGICMAFWGQVEDATGAGMVAILETADDAAIEIIPNPDKLLQVNASWDPSMKEFRYPRLLRFAFFDKGGHVAVCKRYRQHAKETGLWVPFTEKVKKNPNIDKLLGAANIWCFGWDWIANRQDWTDMKIALVKEMQSLGMDRILWSGGGNAKELAELNTLPNVLTSRYDIYQDIMDPSRFGEVRYVHGDWTTDAWPQDINWAAADGTWRKGWEVETKDTTKPRIPCAVICDAKAVPYAQKRISKELETKPYTCRFIDTTVAAPWFECYHPDHPMTRSDSKKHKMELLKLIGDLGLVCGSETGHDASVPFCDYYEGMLSLGPYRVPESGRDMIRIWDEVPPQIEWFQVNPALRLPLWELVYHDCVVAQWYWGDYNNKLPKVWRKRDLFNALYGTPPMYMFTRKNWDENKEKFVESYKTAEPVSRATAYAEMVDHKILSTDRMVQQSIFSNGVTVTVNFGDQPFKLPDGSILNGLDWKMEKK